MSHNLLLTGPVAIDTIYTPKGSASDQLGGSVSFAALAARHWREPVILSAVGGDFPEDLRQILLRAGLELKHLTVDMHAKTFRWAGKYDAGLGTRETVGVELGVMSTHTLHAPELSHVKYAMMGNYHPARQLELLPKLPKDCFVAMDTIHAWITYERENLTTLAHACHLITIDKDELLQWAQIDNEAAAVKKLLSWGPKWIIITYGVDGSRL